MTEPNDPKADEHDPPQEKGAYKLPHHELVDGQLRLVMARRHGGHDGGQRARGGVDIPDADRRRVYDHLAAHYAEFDEEPPDYEAG